MIKKQYISVFFSLACAFLLLGAIFSQNFFTSRAQNVRNSKNEIRKPGDFDKPQTTLVPSVLTSGDIAIVGYITNGSPDTFSFVTLAPLGSGTIIYFTDNGWTGTAFRGVTSTNGAGNEGIYRFTANNDIPAGTVIRSNDSSPNFTWTTSGAIGAGGNYSIPAFANDGEQIAAVQSTTATNPLFSGYTPIFQIDNTGAFENATTSGTGNVIPGLSQSANTAVLLSNLATNGTFRLNTLASGTKEQWLAAINTPANWTFSSATTLPNGTIVVGTAANNPPTITENTASPLLSLAATGSGSLSGVIGDATDPGRTLGVDFTIADAETPVASLTVTLASSNPAVVPDGNLNLTGAGANRNLKITPAAVGYSTITVTVSDGTTPVSYTINYAASAAPANANAATRFHTGKADASTAVAVDDDYMLVADDEDQTIRLYDRSESGMPLASFNFTANLGLTDTSGGVPREVDIEASARVGSRIYWLASHSNSSSGANRPNRSRLFATDISGSGANTTLTYVGRYDSLKTDLITWDNANGHGLGAGFFGLQASAAVGVIPEQADGGGFNIEGLAFAPDNATAYVAFRAPISPASNRTRALIVPVTNFTGLVSGNPSGGPALFGAPLQLNLGGMGIREIKKNAADEYLIVGGSAGSTGTFALFSWTGNPADPAIFRNAALAGLNPESIVDVPLGLNSLAPNGAIDVQLLSDNGDDVYYNDGVIAKELPANEFKKFRSDVVTVAAAPPTAAYASISGRIFDQKGISIPRAQIRITNTDTGEVRTVQTNSFGVFNIGNLAAGITYVIEVRAKAHIFEPRFVALNEDITELNFTAQ